MKLFFGAGNFEIFWNILLFSNEIFKIKVSEAAWNCCCSNHSWVSFFVHIFVWVVHRSEVSIILLLDHHHPICLKYGRDFPTFACICNQTTSSRSLYAWSHLCCNNPNAIWSNWFYLIHTSSTQFTNKNQELHELCWSLTDEWVWQEVGSNTCKGWVLVLWSIWRVNANCTSRNPE